MNTSDLFMDSSILYRSTQKYFDRMLQDYHLTYAQLPVLIMVYENEGLSLQDIAIQGVYDKGTITKNVQKLEALGYLTVSPSKKDKRARELYTTPLTKSIMVDIYTMRKEWWKHLNGKLSEEELNQFSKTFLSITESAKNLADKNESKIQFYDHQKVNLTIYPDKISTVLYTAGCNFQCSNCKRKDLVFLKENRVELPLHDIESYLEKRKGTIQAICIKGGEACMHPELSSFLMYAKSLHYKVMIQTNGTYPEQLLDWIQDGLVDRVAINIKQEPDQYAKAIGIPDFKVEKIERTIEILEENEIEFVYETNLDKDTCTVDDCIKIAKWLKSDVPYDLYFEDMEASEMDRYLKEIKKYMPQARIGGSV